MPPHCFLRWGCELPSGSSLAAVPDDIVMPCHPFKPMGPGPRRHDDSACAAGGQVPAGEDASTAKDPSCAYRLSRPTSPAA